MAIDNRLIEILDVREHLFEACFYEIENPFHEDDETMLDIFFFFEHEEIMRIFIIYIEHFLYDAHHGSEDNAVFFDFMSSDVHAFHDVFEARPQCTPIFQIYIFVSKEGTLDQYLIIGVQIAFFYDIDDVLDLSVNNVLVDEEIEEVVLCGIIASSFYGRYHVCILSEVDLFCKSLA